MHTESPIKGGERQPLYGPPGRIARQDAPAVTLAERDHRRPPPASPPPASQPPGAGLDVGQLLRTLRRRLPIIIAMVVLGGALGTVVQSKIKPRYTSFVELLLEPKRSDSFGADTQFAGVLVDVSKIASVVSVIESADLLTRVVVEQHLDQLPEFGDAPDSRLHKWFGFLPFVKPPVVDNSPDARVGRALNQLARTVNVQRVGVTYVLTISAQASRPDIAQRVAGAVADAYLSDQVDRKMATTKRDSVWLAERLNDVRRDLKQSEEALDSVRRKYGLLETDHGSGATMDRQVLTDLNARLTDAQAEVATVRARYEQVQTVQASGRSLEGLPDVASSHVIGELRTTEAELAQKLSALRSIYKENFPDIQHIKDQQQVVRAEIAAEVARIVDVRRNEYEAAVARERALNDRLQHAVTSDGGAAGDEGREQVRDAQRAVDADRALYETLATKWRDVQQQQTREEPEARIISQANLPSLPSSPKPLIFPAGGAVAMLFLGLGLTIVPTLFDKRFFSVTAVEQRLGLPVLGAIPMLQRRDLVLRGDERSIVDYTRRWPLSRFAESLRMVRAYLRISTHGGSNVLQVTSAIPGEGKSTVAAALAISAATAGVRTVLIDADLRFSSVSAMFGIGHREGLADILERGVPLQSALYMLEESPLAVLSTGTSLLPRPDFFDSKRFTALIQELSERYSLVVIDCPPVLPVSDALVISKQASATILVVQWRSTARDLTEQAVKLLRSINAPLAGVIVNKIDLSKVTQYASAYSDYHQPGVKRRQA